MNKVVQRLFIKPILTHLVLISYLLITIGCDHIYKAKQDSVIARVGTSYLYNSELENNLPVFLTESDSTIKADNYINNWARNQLLFQQATINLDFELQDELENLVESYKSDLWSSTYKEFIVKSAIDTVVSIAEIQSYYDENKNNFKVNEVLINLRYISLPEKNINLDEISNKFTRFEDDDKHFIDSLSYQFTSYSVKEDFWLSKREFVKYFPIVEEDFENYLKKSQFFALEGAFEVYLLFVNDFVLRNEIAPLETVRNTIRKIVFNKRKRDFIRQFDKEILQDAIRTNQFEIYN